jgi:hypothetical protein
MESSRFLWRRLETSYSLLIILLPAYLINVLVLALTATSGVDPAVVSTWVGLSAAVAGAWLAAAWLLRQPDSPQAAAASRVAMAGFALTQALLYSWFLNLAFPVSDLTGQVVLASFTIALLSLGSVTLATLPWAAVTWVIGLVCGVGVTLGADSRWRSPGPWIMLGSFLTALVLFTLSYGRMFRERLRVETESAQRADMVGLLLHEFESDSQDWTWETDAQAASATLRCDFPSSWGARRRNWPAARWSNCWSTTGQGRPSRTRRTWPRWRRGLPAASPFAIWRCRSKAPICTAGGGCRAAPCTTVGSSPGGVVSAATSPKFSASTTSTPAWRCSTT